MNKPKLRYAILKEFDNGNKTLTNNDLGIDESIFHEQIRFLSREGFIKGVLYADNIPYSLHGVVLTLEGETYLEQNTPWRKLYRGIKEIKDFIK